MSKAPKPDVWMPLYIEDWDRKTKHLDCEQDGAYGRLVRHYWVNGPLPDDDAQLARIVGMERARWRKVRPSVAPFFSVVDGRWHHGRVDEELDRAREIIEKRRQAGLQGGRPRKQMVSQDESKPKANGYSGEKQMGKQTETPTRVEVEVSETSPLASHEAVEQDSQSLGSSAPIISLADRVSR